MEQWKCKINGETVLLSGAPTDRLRDVLYRTGYYSVRDSDDAEGFCGSDTIIFNGKLRYSNLILLYQAENAEIRTAESLLQPGRELNYVQKAMVASERVEAINSTVEVEPVVTMLGEENAAVLLDGVDCVVDCLDNLEARLKNVVNGTFEITSTPGKGTVAVVTIPKKAKKSRS